MPAHLPPHLYTRTYRTSSGRKRTLYYVRFVTWQGRLMRVPAGDSKQYAIGLRDRLRGLNTLRYDFLRDPENALGKRKEGTPAPETLRKWVARFFLLKQSKRSLAKDRSNSSRLLQFFAGGGSEVVLAEISTARIEDYKLARSGAHGRHGNLPKPATINRELALLRSILRMAQEQDALDKLPKIRLFAEHNERHRTATREEFERLLAAVAHQPSVSDVLEILWEQGLRENEVVGLRWSQVDLQTQTFVFASFSKKEKLPHSPPMSPRTVEILTRRAHAAGVLAQNSEARASSKSMSVPATSLLQATLDPPTADYVFTTTRGGRLKPRWFKRLVSKAMGAANIRRLWIHDLRGTFITRKVIEEGYDRELVKIVTGHSTDSAFERYLRPTTEQTREMLRGRGRHETATRGDYAVDLIEREPVSHDERLRKVRVLH